MKKYIHLLIVPVCCILVCALSFNNTTSYTTTAVETTWGSYSKIVFEAVSDSFGLFPPCTTVNRYNGIIERIAVFPDTNTGFEPKDNWDFILYDDDDGELQKEESDGSGSITDYGDNLDSVNVLNIIDLDVPVAYSKIRLVQPTDSSMIGDTTGIGGAGSVASDTVRAKIIVYIRNVRNLF